MHMPKKDSNGFTIVELLIVIVVIAILAAIGVATYRGVQERAYAAKAASIADVYISAIKMYKAEKGVYPEVSGDNSWSFVCLGTANDYPANSTYSAGDCHRDDSFSYREGVSSGLNTLLSSYMNSAPSGALPSVFDGEDRYFRGVRYWSTSGWGYIYYVLKGHQDCPKGTRSDFGMNNDLTWCSITL